jgi:hypothetical protein
MDNNLKINNLNFQKLHALQQVFKWVEQAV